MHVEQCYFHEGVHYGPEGCYHETTLEPVEMQPGWTVQTPSSPKPAYLEKDDVS